MNISHILMLQRNRCEQYEYQQHLWITTQLFHVMFQSVQFAKCIAQFQNQCVCNLQIQGSHSLAHKKFQDFFRTFQDSQNVISSLLYTACALLNLL